MKDHSRLFFFTFLPFLLLSGTVSAKTADSLVLGYFSKIQEKLEDISRQKELQSSKSSDLELFLLRVMVDNPEFTSILKVSSKGTVLSEIARGKKKPTRFRSIAAQKVFKDLKKSGEPYYGALKLKSGKRHLLWGAPIAPARKKSRNFEGAVIVRIDMSECLGRFALKHGKPLLFEIEEEDYFSFMWIDNASVVEKPLEIPGLESTKILFTQQYRPVSDTLPNVPDQLQSAEPALTSAVAAEESVLKASSGPPESSLLTAAAETGSAARQPPESAFTPSVKTKFPIGLVGGAGVGLLAIIFGILLVVSNRREQNRIL